MRRDSILLLALAAHVALGAEPDPGSAQVRVRLVTLNDLHGHLAPGRVGSRPAGGIGALAAWMRAAKAEAEGTTIFVHAGDLFGASPAASALAQDEPTVSFVNSLANDRCSGKPPWNPGCNVVGALGNHELDEGRAELLRVLQGGNHASGPFLENPWKGAHYPTLCANVIDSKSGKSILPGHVVLDAGGIRIGVVGAVTRETRELVLPDRLAGLTILDEADSINREVVALRAEGVRTIVVAIHEGSEQKRYTGPTNADADPPRGPIEGIVRRLDGEVDVVVSGHAHKFTNARMRNAAGNRVLVTQAFSYGTAIGVVDLRVDRRTKEVTWSSAEIRTTWGDEGPGRTPDRAATAIAASAAARIEKLTSRVVGRAAEAITREDCRDGECALGDLVADAHRETMKADVAFTNAGGLREDLPAGTLTWGDLFDAQPFQNRLVAMEMTGAEILEVLESQWRAHGRPRFLQVSGLRYTWSRARPVGKKIVRATIGTDPIRREATYVVACNDYLAQGGDGFPGFRDGRKRRTGPTDLDALVKWVESQKGPIAPAVDGRVRPSS